jgi:hypothetical protein
MHMKTVIATSALEPLLHVDDVMQLQAKLLLDSKCTWACWHLAGGSRQVSRCCADRSRWVPTVLSLQRRTDMKLLLDLSTIYWLQKGQSSGHNCHIDEHFAACSTIC